ncbi:BTAD domain-containing putative transcriptional regulator [Glycomyces terrestris]|uniref:AfsR/SARP family transcriptional regulator n=1 Tax=Glycomyces terrestris TaxID=2493553 RepID=A0A426UW90_9ACTN|nr:BTAD domain-containing putative transcriptional regulator [Glycomyces terrestris]RRR98459.1 AfsR/SARP family transcriptional regulator [Glycomyces terrestris]
MRFGILGPLEVRTDAGEPVPVAERKVRALLARLLVDPGRTVAVDRLVEDLWGGRPPKHPRAALQTKVSHLRRLGAAVERVGDGYRIAAAPEDVDAGRFEALAVQAEQAGAAARVELLEEALRLWRGPALAEYDVLAGEAARLEARRMDVREALLEARLEIGHRGGVLADAAALIEHRPLSERLRAVHMRALYLDGRQNEALASYRMLRDRLASELGLEPGPDLRGLHRAMLNHDPALAPAPRGNLPAAPTPLIGRERDLDALLAALAEARLVTLTGPGGVGKTRLALAAAAAAPAPGGAWLIELGAFDTGVDAVRLAAAVAEAMGLLESAPRIAPGGAGDPLTVLKGAFASKPPLVVLDNCEHLAEPAAELCARLLAACPGTRILATSREPLRVPGERLRRVDPLDADAAVRLFADRAADADPAFAVTPVNRAAVAALCDRLDRLPLALELAATRVHALGVDALAAQLDDRLLDARARGLPERQRSLRAVLDWSWRLLSGPERTVLTALSTAWDADLETVAVLCASQLAEHEAAAALAGLVDRSLARTDDSSGDRRYRLLESVAVYGRERLREAGAYETAATAHLDRFTRLAEASATALRGPGQRRWLRRLDADAANVHIAFDTAVRQREAEQAMRLAVALSWYWFLRGSVLEGARSLAVALGIDGPAPDGLRASALFWRSCYAAMTAPADGLTLADAPKHLAAMTDQHERARAELFLSLTHLGVEDTDAAEAFAVSAGEYFEAAGDRWGSAAVDASLSWFAMLRGDLARARLLAERGRDAFAAIGDAWGTLQTLETLAVRAESVGEYEDAKRLNLQALDLAEGLDLRMEQSYRLSRLGRVEMLRGDLDEARRLHRRAYDMAVEQSVAFCRMFAATGLMFTARRSGDLDEAERIAREWLPWVAGPPMLADAYTMLLAELGFAAEMRGDAHDALRLHRESLAAARGREPFAAAHAIEGIAGARSLLGDVETAAVLLGGAAALRAHAGIPLPQGERFDVDRIAGRLAATMGRKAFEAAYERGRRLNSVAEVAALDT